MAKQGQARGRVEVTHPDRVVFPDDGITKHDLVAYYRDIASVMLPHIRDRVVTMQRFPEGITAEGFMQQQIPEYFPDWIDRVTVAKQKGEVTHPVVNTADALAYIANQGCITPHVWLSRTDKLVHPDRLIFDLDPPGSDFEPVRRAALALRDLLTELELEPFVKTTGKRGAHVTVPLRRGSDFDEVRAFARQVASVLAARYPEELTTEQRKHARGERLYLDTFRNAYGQHVVAEYSLRPVAGAAVAAPLHWQELEDGTTPGSVTYRDVFDWLNRRGDPWSDIQKHGKSLSDAQKKLPKVAER